MDLLLRLSQVGEPQVAPRFTVVKRVHRSSDLTGLACVYFDSFILIQKKLQG
jgi:hypothetical protein